MYKQFSYRPVEVFRLGITYLCCFNNDNFCYKIQLQLLCFSPLSKLIGVQTPFFFLLLLCLLQINLPYIFTLVFNECTDKIVLVLVVLRATGSSKQ